MQRSLASSARAVQRIAASSIGTCRSSLIADASAWPSSGDTSIERMRDAIAPLTYSGVPKVGEPVRMSTFEVNAP